MDSGELFCSTCQKIEKANASHLRYLLKKAGFCLFEKSAWISLSHMNIYLQILKKDLGLGAEMMIIVTQFIDEETKKVLFETFRNKLIYFLL